MANLTRSVKKRLAWLFGSAMRAVPSASEPPPPDEAASPPAASPAPPEPEGMQAGQGTHIDPTVQVLGWRNVRIGARCVIGEYSWLNSNDRARADIQIDIGDHSFVGRRNFIGSGRLVSIGPFFLSGPDCKIVCSDHIIDDPFRPFMSSGAWVRDSIIIGTNCWFGGGASVLGNVRIGHGCVIGANSSVLSDIPPFSIAVGTPARVIKRFDMRSRTWVRSGDFSPEAEALLPDEDSYRAGMLAGFATLDLPAVAAGYRGGNIP